MEKNLEKTDTRIKVLESRPRFFKALLGIIWTLL